MLIYICVICALSLSNSFVLATEPATEPAIVAEVFIGTELSYNDNDMNNIKRIPNNSMINIRSDVNQYKIVFHCQWQGQNTVWYYPNGIQANHSNLLVLKNGMDAAIDEGIYKCVMIDLKNVNQTLFVGLYTHDNSGPIISNIHFNLSASNVSFIVENGTATYIECTVDEIAIETDITQYIQTYELPTKILASLKFDSSVQGLRVCSINAIVVNIYECGSPVHVASHVVYVLLVNATELEPSLTKISSCIQTIPSSVNQTPSTTTINISTSPNNTCTFNTANTNSIKSPYLAGIGFLLVSNLITAAICIACITLILKKHFKNEKLKVENQPSDIQIEQTQLNHTYSVAEVGPTQSDYTYSEITKRIEPDTSALNNPAGYIYSTVDKKRNKDSTKCVYSSADNIAVVSDQ